jgi:hypothetical protein
MVQHQQEQQQLQNQNNNNNNNNNTDDDNKSKDSSPNSALNINIAHSVATSPIHLPIVMPVSCQSLTDTADGNTNSSSSSPPLVGVPHTSSPDVAAELEHSSPEDVVLGSGGESPQAGCC